MLPKKDRISLKSEFEDIKQDGKRFSTQLFTLVFLKASESKFGVIITKKVEPKAVKRNRLKRIVFESFRINKGKLKPGKYLLLCKRQIVTSTYEEILTEIQKVVAII